MKKCPIDHNQLVQSVHTPTSYICNVCKSNKRNGLYDIKELNDQNTVTVQLIRRYRLKDIPAFDNPDVIEIPFVAKLNTETGFVSDIQEKDLKFFQTRYGQDVPEIDSEFLDFPIRSLEDSLRERVFRTDDKRIYIPLHKVKYLQSVLAHDKLIK